MENNLKSGFNTARLITKEYAKTFYFASHFLPQEKKLAAYSVYAICRISDEAVDSDKSTARENELNKLEEKINSAYNKGYSDDNLLLAFSATVNKYEIPKEYFGELISGMRMDLEKTRYENFKELNLYCYRVAGVVGLIMLKILGYRSIDAVKYAQDLGLAMQLTNILRDIKDDYLKGRIYLPQEEIFRFGLSNKNFKGKIDDNFRSLMRFQIKRARDYYTESLKGIKLISSLRSRIVVLAMSGIYARILKKIEMNDYDVFKTRAQVNIFEKMLIALKAIIRSIA